MIQVDRVNIPPVVAISGARSMAEPTTDFMPNNKAATKHQETPDPRLWGETTDQTERQHRDHEGGIAQ